MCGKSEVKVIKVFWEGGSGQTYQRLLRALTQWGQNIGHWNCQCGYSCWSL